DEEALERTEKSTRAPRDTGQLDEAMCQRRAMLLTCALLSADRPPEGVDDLGWVTADRVDRTLEVLRPKTQANLFHDTWILSYEVQLCVVEERMLVEIRGAQGEPTIVDDRELRVDVDRRTPVAGPSVERARQQSFCTRVRSNQLGQNTTRVVGTGVGSRGENHEHAEV